MSLVRKRPADDGDHDSVAVQTSKKPNKGTQATSLDDFEPNPSSDNLEQLVGVSDLSASSQDIIKERFKTIADSILCKYHLVVGSTSQSDPTTSEFEYEVLELEFYLWMERSHEDPFTHGSEEQRICGQWYFHRSPKYSADSHRSLTSQTGYRGGSRKGLDLTIGTRRAMPTLDGLSINHDSTSRFPPTAGHPQPGGDEAMSSGSVPDIRGGILLRSIRRVSDGKVISGPSLLVDEILQASHASSIPELVSTKWNGNINAFYSDCSTYLRFRPRPPPGPPRKSRGLMDQYLKIPKNVDTKNTANCIPGPNRTPTVHSSPRIGLDLSHPGTTTSRDHPRLVFLSKLYRFFVSPELLEKGRPQSFLGILHSCLQCGHVLRAGDANSSASSSSRNSVPNAKLRAEVVRIMGVKESTVEKYFTEYLAGLDKGVIKLYIGAAGKGASTSPATYLRMVGALKSISDST